MPVWLPGSLLYVQCAGTAGSPVWPLCCRLHAICRCCHCRHFHCCLLLRLQGRAGRMRGRTFSAPKKWLPGKGRMTMQFGCCYNYATDSQGRPPGVPPPPSFCCCCCSWLLGGCLTLCLDALRRPSLPVRPLSCRTAPPPCPTCLPVPAPAACLPACPSCLPATPTFLLMCTCLPAHLPACLSAGILADEIVEPMPPLLRALCRRLTRWGVLPAAREPNTAIINIYEPVGG